MAQSVPRESSTNQVKTQKKKARLQRWLTAYGFVLPALLLFVFFELFSLLYNIFISLHQWQGFGTPEFISFMD